MYFANLSAIECNAGLNSEFVWVFFSESGCLTKTKELCLLFYLAKVGLVETMDSCLCQGHKREQKYKHKLELWWNQADSTGSRKITGVKLW